MARALSLALAWALFATSRSALAQTVPSPDCPRCPGPVPPGSPPPQSDLAARAIAAAAERDAYAHAPEMQAAANAEVDAERRAAWNQRVEAMAPPDIPTTYPLREAFVAFRPGVTGTEDTREHVAIGIEAGGVYRFDRSAAPVEYGPGIAVAGSLLRADERGAKGTLLGLNPSLDFTLGAHSSSAVALLRVGPDLLVPLERTGPIPDAQVGVFGALGGIFYVGRIPGGGYAGFSFEVRVAVRGRIGGDDTLPPLRLGVDLPLALRIGL